MNRRNAREEKMRRREIEASMDGWMDVGRVGVELAGGACHVRRIGYYYLAVLYGFLFLFVFLCEGG